jgi:hypothetical protein
MSTLLKSTAKGRRHGGRAKGTPNKATAEVREAAKAYTLKALETLADLMQNSPIDQVRLQAAQALLDRAHGKVARAEPPAPEAETKPEAPPPERRMPIILPDNGRDPGSSWGWDSAVMVVPSEVLDWLDQVGPPPGFEGHDPARGWHSPGLD